MPRVDTTAEHDFGRLEIDGGRAVVRYIRHLAHPREKVWRALTEDEHLQAWFPTTVEGDRAAGAPLTFRHRDVDLPAMSGEMLTFAPPSLLEMAWGEDHLRFELSNAEGGTLLALTVTMAEVGKAARDGAGWHVCLAGLERDLAGESASSSEADDWRAVNEVYVTRFGAAASTIGPPQEWEDARG